MKGRNDFTPLAPVEQAYLRALASGDRRAIEKAREALEQAQRARRQYQERQER